MKDEESKRWCQTCSFMMVPHLKLSAMDICMEDQHLHQWHVFRTLRKKIRISFYIPAFLPFRVLRICCSTTFSFSLIKPNYKLWFIHVRALSPCANSSEVLGSARHGSVTSASRLSRAIGSHPLSIDWIGLWLRVHLILQRRSFYC